MRMRRINSLQASKLARSLRSSALHSKARVSGSPETLTKRGKIRRVSHRSINKLSIPRDNSSLLDGGGDKEIHALNRRLTRSSLGEGEGSQPLDVHRRIREGKTKNFREQWKANSKDVNKGRKGRRTIKLDKLRLQGNMSGIMHSGVLADRRLTRRDTSKRRPSFENNASSIANKQDETAYYHARSPKKLQQARALLMSLRRQKRLTSSLISKGVTTRHKANAKPQGQPDERQAAKQISKNEGGPGEVVKGNSAAMTRNGKLQRRISLSETKVVMPLDQEKEGLLEEGKARRLRGSSVKILVHDVQSNSRWKKEGSQRLVRRSRRAVNLEDSKQTNEATLVECKQEDLTPARLSDSFVTPRQRKRRKFSSQHEEAPRAFISDNCLSERLRQDNGVSRVRGQANNTVLDNVETAAKVRENEIGAGMDVLKIDPASKSCLVATNPTETGGRQMRPRPLDLEQPLLVLVEGSNQDYYDFDGGSFYQMVQQQPESKLTCSSNLKSHGSHRKSPEVLEKAGSILIPSFRNMIDYENSSQGSYVLPESYIRGNSEDRTCQAEYDMDDEDEEWLNKYNQSASPKSTLSADQFEQIVELLENKANGANGLNSISQAVEDNKEQASEECCICNGGENSVTNLVYQCSSCNILVHQSCYGIQRGKRSAQKRKKWKCRKCEAVAEGIEDANASCTLCCKQGGALKPTTQPHRWAHVVCALYTNETYFVNPDAMEPIEGVKAADMRAKRQKRKCWLCRMREGCVEKCSVPACKVLFHVSCGVIQGASFVLQHSNRQVTSVRVYCPKHALENAKAMAELDQQKEISQESPEESPRRLGQRNSPGQSRMPRRHLCADHSKDYGEASNGRSLINGCTQKVLDTAGEGLDRVAAEMAHVALSIDEGQQVGPMSPALMEGIYLYWVSKRAKQGGALLHHIQQEHAAKQFGIFNSDEDNDDDDNDDVPQAPSAAMPGCSLIRQNDTSTSMAATDSIANELDHMESQRILEEESLRLGQEDLSSFSLPADGVERKGKRLNLKAIKKLCPDHFVRDTLFKGSKQANGTLSLKLSNLQHTGVARTILLRFCQKEQCLPKDNEVDIDFVQQCYVQDILKKRVNWQDSLHNIGSGFGTMVEGGSAIHDMHASSGKHAMFFSKEHEKILRLLSEDTALASCGEITELMRAKVEHLCHENVDLKRELMDVKGKLAVYKQVYGELPHSLLF